MDSKTTYQIPTALGTSLPLTGKGLERIIDPITGEVIAEFWDGNFPVASPSLSTADRRLMEEPTLLLTKVA